MSIDSGTVFDVPLEDGVSTTSEKVEAVAKAICAVYLTWEGWDEKHEMERNSYRKMAIAAIKEFIKSGG